MFKVRFIYLNYEEKRREGKGFYEKTKWVSLGKKRIFRRTNRRKQFVRPLYVGESGLSFFMAKKVAWKKIYGCFTLGLFLGEDLFQRGNLFQPHFSEVVAFSQIREDPKKASFLNLLNLKYLQLKVIFISTMGFQVSTSQDKISW